MSYRKSNADASTDWIVIPFSSTACWSRYPTLTFFAHSTFPSSGDVEQGDYLEIGYFEQETPAGIETTCLEEIWQEFPGYTQYEVRSALAKCGLTTKHIESKVKVLSGGEQAKVRLCKLINRESNILVLDEPTNHLDVDAKDELKRALMAYKGSILMVCHEPEFYDGLATDVWEMYIKRGDEEKIFTLDKEFHGSLYKMCGTAESGQHVFNH